MAEKQKPFTQTDKRQIFNEFFNYQNSIVTPNVIGFYVNRKMIAEVSQGRGFTNELRYGVAFLEFENGAWKRRFDLQQSNMNSLEKAKEYAKTTCRKGYALFYPSGQPMLI